jgi:hypothetical protein
LVIRPWPLANPKAVVTPKGLSEECIVSATVEAMQTGTQQTDFNNLIPEMRSWNNGNGIDVDSWIQCMANHKVLVGCARILWPDFVERDGCIVLARHAPNWQGYLEKAHGDRKIAEATINHIHVLHLFATELPTRALVLHVGRLLKEIWQVKLQHHFPGRKITISFPQEDDLELSEYELTFFQEP